MTHSLPRNDVRLNDAFAVAFNSNQSDTSGINADASDSHSSTSCDGVASEMQLSQKTAIVVVVTAIGTVHPKSPMMLLRLLVSANGTTKITRLSTSNHQRYSHSKEHSLFVVVVVA